MPDAIDRADLIGDPRFDDEDERIEHCEEAANVITEWTKRHTKSEAMQTFGEAGVLAGATLGATELLDDHHLAAREMVVNVEDPVRDHSESFSIQTQEPNLEVLNLLVAVLLLAIVCLVVAWKILVTR